MKSPEQLTDLFEKYIANSCTPEETQELMDYFQSDVHPELLKEMVINTLSKPDENHQQNPVIANLVAKVDAELLHKINASKQIPVKKFKSKTEIWRTVISAAAAVAVIFFGIYFFKSGKESGNYGNGAFRQDLPSGKIGATLTLGNGKKIQLNEATAGHLSTETGVSIIKSADGRLVYSMINPTTGGDATNTLSTANGETYELTLADGSSVWLNSASSLTFNTRLDENGRRFVRLTGEAYFQVAKDKQHSFIVQSQGQQVEVLGTHFNINSYSDEAATATTLIEGSVKVTTATGIRMLQPGEQAITAGEKIEVRIVDVERVADWKDGDFFLDGVEFKTAMRKIARWYDVEVIYDDSISDRIRSGGWISRKNSLLTVLKSIESSGQAHFKLEGRKLYVKK